MPGRGKADGGEVRHGLPHHLHAVVDALEQRETHAIALEVHLRRLHATPGPPGVVAPRRQQVDHRVGSLAVGFVKLQRVQAASPFAQPLLAPLLVPLRAEKADVRVVAHEPRHRLAEHGEVHAGRVHVVAESHRLGRLDEYAFAVDVTHLDRIHAVKRLGLAVAIPPSGVVVQLGGDEIHVGKIGEMHLEVIAALGDPRVAAQRLVKRCRHFLKPGGHERAAALVQVDEGVHERSVILVGDGRLWRLPLRLLARGSRGEGFFSSRLGQGVRAIVLTRVEVDDVHASACSICNAEGGEHRGIGVLIRKRGRGSEVRGIDLRRAERGVVEEHLGAREDVVVGEVRAEVADALDPDLTHRRILHALDRDVQPHRHRADGQERHRAEESERNRVAFHQATVIRSLQTGHIGDASEKEDLLAVVCRSVRRCVARGCHRAVAGHIARV